MDLFTTTLILILAVSLSGVFTRVLPLNLPVPLIQVALGALLAYVGIELKLEPEVFFVLFIPPLLFADGRQTKLSDFLRYRREILGLVVVLVLLTVVGLGYLLNFLIPTISLPLAFALAAVLSPTDAVALSGIVGQGKITKSKMEVLEGESLMNDASGLVSFKFALLVATGAIEFNLFNASISFVLVSLGGLGTGIIVTWLYTKLLRQVGKMTNDDPITQILLLGLLPFAAYLIAEQLGGSGILAAVSAGMTVNYSGIMRSAPLATRLQSDSVWTMLTFTFNGMVFLLLGLQLPQILTDTLSELKDDHFVELWQLYAAVFAIYFALMITRFLWLLSMKHFSLRLRKKRPLLFEEYSLSDLLISTFAGVRGAITLAGVLSIPASLYGRYEVVFIAAGVIILSLIFATALLPLLMRSNKSFVDKPTLAKEEEFARKTIASEAVRSLEKMQERISRDTTESISSEIIAEIGARVVGDFRHRISVSVEEENLERRMRLIAIGAERATLYQLRAKNEISDEVMEKILYELDIQETVLASDN